MTIPSTNREYNFNPSGPLALRPREAAKMLGVSERTLWAWTKAGRIPCVRIGEGKKQLTLYPVRELQEWLSQQARAGQGGEQ